MLTAQRAIELSERPSDDPDKMLYRMLLQGTRFYLDNNTAEPDNAAINDAIELLAEAANLRLTQSECRALMALYPQARIKLAVFGCNDTEVSDLLHNALAMALLGCEWPTYGDAVGVGRFVAALQSQAEALGFGTKL